MSNGYPGSTMQPLQGVNANQALAGLDMDTYWVAEQPHGSAPLWEWCRGQDVGPLQAASLPADAWGVYSVELNDAIELAFRERKRSADITVGARDFRVTFRREPGFATQSAVASGKRRLVRRRLLPVHARDAALHPSGASQSSSSEACPICVQPFAETVAMQTFTLPACGHKLHAVCSQTLADSAQACPLCRSAVDWKAAFATLECSSPSLQSGNSVGPTCRRPGCTRLTWNGQANEFCGRLCREVGASQLLVCQRVGCGKPTWNGMPNEFCSRTCRPGGKGKGKGYR